MPYADPSKQKEYQSDPDFREAEALRKYHKKRTNKGEDNATPGTALS
jgi:hypothetical protein